VFSHLAASDNPQFDDFTTLQMNRFEGLCKQLETGLGYAFLKHLSNSSGITRFKAAHFDMVRLGIGLYGIGSNEKEQQLLENVGVLKTKISQIKSLEAGESVSYNRSGQLNKKSRIAVIPIGYADGFSRLFGNGKHGVYINKQFCKTIGNICMDMSMIDVSDCPCDEGDEVIIFENPEHIHALAKALGSIPYEVLTNVSGRVKRVYVRE
jgi:alanine racemase